MAIEFDIRIIGETTLEVTRNLVELGARLANGLGVAPLHADTIDMTPPAAADANGGGKPASTRKRAPKPEPEAQAAPEPSKLDRAAIIEGLTKVYSKGDEDVRRAITKFRDGQGADRLRDLKDDALPAAAELLTELKLLESADAP
jgi:hypothetical protein